MFVQTITTCHNHVLVPMAHDPLLREVADNSLSIDGGDVVFFKGERCPLSNCYYNVQHPILIEWDEGDSCTL